MSAVRDVLVAATGRGDDAAAVAAACEIAGRTGAHVAVLVQVRVPVPESGALGPFPAEAYSLLQDEVVRLGEAACARWREALRLAGVPGEARLVWDVLSSMADTAAMHAQYADLAIVGLGERGTLPFEVHDQCSRMLLASGRPVLAMASGAAGVPVSPRVVIAWRPGAHAARAVHDALPLMAGASAVDVLCIDPGQGGIAHEREPGAGIARHLARHGFPVTVHSLPAVDGEPGVVLLRHAREVGAGLLVMGGYGHSRLREWILGGTTRHVLTHAHLPVLMAH